MPSEYIVSVLASRHRKTILYAVGLGTLASACSCGILALAIELYRKGASTSAVVAFLLASPWANLPLTFVLVGFFGWFKALYIVGAAVVIALITGFIFQYLERKGWVENNRTLEGLAEGVSFWQDWTARLRRRSFTFEQARKDISGITHGTLRLAQMVLWWLLIGMAVASFLGAYVPHEIFRQYLGPTAGGMAATLLLATVIEVCSEGTAPLAFEIYRQTAALGNSFVFLMAGVVTDYTEIGLLWHNVGRKTALWLPLVTVPQVCAWGTLANFIFR